MLGGGCVWGPRADFPASDTTGRGSVAWQHIQQEQDIDHNLVVLSALGGRKAFFLLLSPCDGGERVSGC